MAEFWTEKYFPQSLEEFIGNSEIAREVEHWAIEWNKKRGGKPLLLWGQTGSGKTALAQLIAKINDWDLFELNASDFRTQEIIERVAGAAIRNSSFSGKLRLVLLDEIDGLHGKEDKGGAAAIASLLKEAKNPVILTANEIYGDKKLLGIRGLCKVLEFKKINYLSMAKFLKDVCKKEGIAFEDEAVAQLAKNSAGDMRSALLDLQTLASAKKKIGLADLSLLGYRERQEDMFKVLRKIFAAKTIEEAGKARAMSEADDELLLRWIEENIPRQYTEAEDTAAAFERLSKADVFNGRILRRQHWGFLRYSSELMTSGVALAREHDYHDFVLYQFPRLLSSLSKSSGQRAMKKAIAAKIGDKNHSSAREVMAEDLPFFQQLFENKTVAPSLAAAYDFDEDEIAFLMGSSQETKKVQEVFAKAQELKKHWLIEKHKHRALLGAQGARNSLHSYSEENLEKAETSEQAAPEETHKQARLF